MLNQLTIIGGLVADPVLRTVTGRDGEERSVVNIRLAVRRRGGKDAPRDFFNVAIFGAQADTVAKYSAKGRRIAVTGPVELEEWTAKDGTTKASLKISTAREVTIIDWPERDDTAQATSHDQEPAIA